MTWALDISDSRGYPPPPPHTSDRSPRAVGGRSGTAHEVFVLERRANTIETVFVVADLKMNSHGNPLVFEVELAGRGMRICFFTLPPPPPSPFSYSMIFRGNGRGCVM